MNRIKFILKSIFICLILNISACYFLFDRDNSNDPDAGNYKPPVIKASFIPSAISGYVPLEVHFEDNSSGNIETYEWDFDSDGIVDSTEKNPSHTFNLAGTYNVKLKITTRQGLVSDETEEPIKVSFGIPERQTISEGNEGPHVIYPVDLDNDNDIDFICGYCRTYNIIDNKISWWENIENGSKWTEHVIAEADTIDSLFTISIHSADINNDGSMDIIAADYLANGIVWWENDGTPRDDTGGDGNSWTKHIVKTGYTGACSVYADDIDGDGDTDIAGTSNGHSVEDGETIWLISEITWWENVDINPGTGDGNGSSWIEHTIKTGANCATNVRIADIDNDGDKDIIAGIYGYVNSSTGGYDYSEILWFENMDESGTSWTEYIIMPNSGPDYLMCPKELYASDMDGDGDTDIDTAYFQSDEIVIWLNSGAGTSWSRLSIDKDFFGAMSVYAADIDGDGDMDLAGASRLTDEIAWWENVGGKWDDWEEHTVDMQFTQAVSTFIADINRDGFMDIAGAANGYYTTNIDSSLAWWSVYMIDVE